MAVYNLRPHHNGHRRHQRRRRLLKIVAVVSLAYLLLVLMQVLYLHSRHGDEDGHRFLFLLRSLGQASGSFGNASAPVSSSVGLGNLADVGGANSYPRKEQQPSAESSFGSAHIAENTGGGHLNEALVASNQNNSSTSVMGSGMSSLHIVDDEIRDYSNISRPPPALVYLDSSGNATARTNDTRIIYFLHIHKSGGTNMCLAARENGMSTSGRNCNVQPDQRCCGESDGFIAQRGYAQFTKYNFVANERTMYEAMDVESYRYVVLLRNSYDRYVSHWRNVCREHPNTFQESFEEWSKRQPDNWSLRQLCGTRCASVPKFQITEEQLKYTLDRLSKFEDILLLEQYNTTYAEFARKVGWNKMPVPKPYADNFSYPVVARRSSDDTSGWDPFMTVLDDALYEYAEQSLLARQDEMKKITSATTSKMTMTMKQYFELGPSRNCFTECCHGECSLY